MSFHDHFSGHAAEYAQSRPRYPHELFAFIAQSAPALGHAWDCATGNGQAAVALAEYFEWVVATDASEEQLAHKELHERVNYRVSRAEDVPLEDGSMDAITVAQALHWFDFERFFAEARRVLKPGGVLFAWCYELFRSTDAFDAVVDELYHGPVGPFWTAERDYVDSGYRTIPFPFDKIEAPTFEMRNEWNLAETMAYLGTWSALQRCRRETGTDPLADAAPALRAAWGDPEQRKAIRWPLSVLAGRVAP